MKTGAEIISFTLFIFFVSRLELDENAEKADRTCRINNEVHYVH